MTRALFKFAAALAIVAQAGLAVPVAADPINDDAAKELARRAALRVEWPTGWIDSNSNNTQRAGGCAPIPCQSQGAGSAVYGTLPVGKILGSSPVMPSPNTVRAKLR